MKNINDIVVDIGRVSGPWPGKLTACDGVEFDKANGPTHSGTSSERRTQCNNQ